MYNVCQIPDGNVVFSTADLDTANGIVAASVGLFVEVVP